MLHKKVNAQTTAALIMNEQENEEWEENERKDDERERERSIACVHLGLRCLLRLSMSNEMR